MTMSGYSKAIVDTMLGWLKGFANWVLRLFNLAGSTGGSPLLWLSENWLRLLVMLMAIGIAVDILVWLIRWRPHWVWFQKLRVIVDDERFFNEADIQERLNPHDDDFLEKNWEERDYVVASTVVKRRRPERQASGQRRGGKATGRQGGRTTVQRGERRRKPQAAAQEASAQYLEPQKDMFDKDALRPTVTDVYEDEVFNVNNLPAPKEAPGGDGDEA